jgi:hypothetical protein
MQSLIEADNGVRRGQRPRQNKRHESPLRLDSCQWDKRPQRKKARPQIRASGGVIVIVLAFLSACGGSTYTDPETEQLNAQRNKPIDTSKYAVLKLDSADLKRGVKPFKLYSAVV